MSSEYATDVRRAFEAGREKSRLEGGVGLEYMAEASYYHATTIEGFEGDLVAWTNAVMGRRAPNAYEAKQAARRERLEERAEKSERESATARREAERIGSAIPFGQPVLVGHHSEGRHRRDLGRIDRAMGRYIDESKKADELRRRAESVGTAGVSSDDPDAIAKLEAQLATAEARREQEVAANAAVRGHARRRMKVLGVESLGAEDHATIVGLLEADGFPPEVVKGLRRRVLAFPMWLPQLGPNLGREVARLQARIAQLKEASEMEARPAIEFPGGSVVDDKDDNRVRIFFDAKPSEEVRSRLKRAGFKWSPSNSAWQRQRSNAAWALAMEFTRMSG